MTNKKIPVVHLGVGNVGKALVKFISSNPNLIYAAAFNSKGCIYSHSGKKINLGEIIKKIPSPFILVDTTASDDTFGLILKSLKAGNFAVLSNKKPLAGRQKDFDSLMRYGENSLFFETTVGSALPVISSIKNLISLPDKITKIEASVSGTLGYIFSKIDQGVRFSEAVIEAKNKGFTEPDPREDLKGLDVARKALILARLIGQKIELDDLQPPNLYPDFWNKISIPQFLSKLKEIDGNFAKNRRFLVEIKDNQCSIKLVKVSPESDFANLPGPQNLFVISTGIYSDDPLVIKGHGAGIELTAFGVYSDILSALNQIKNVYTEE